MIIKKAQIIERCMHGLDDLSLYGNSYVTVDGRRLDPLRMTLEGSISEQDPEKWIVDRYRYREPDGTEIVFSADEVIRVAI